MIKYWKIIFITFTIFIACSEEEQEQEVISYALKSIRWDDLIIPQYCEESQDSMYVEGVRGLYYADAYYPSDPCDDIEESCCHSSPCDILIYYPESLRVYYWGLWKTRPDTLYLNGKTNIVAIKYIPPPTDPPFP